MKLSSHMVQGTRVERVHEIPKPHISENLSPEPADSQRKADGRIVGAVSLLL